MKYDEVVLGRRSIRGYKPDPVPRKLIEEVLQLAMRAPTSMNTQPWHFYVITGEPLDRIRAGNTERNLAGVPHSREFRIGQPFAGKHRERQIGVAKQLFSAMGIARDDKDARQDWVMRGFRQFDAPVCVIITYDRDVDGSDDSPFDCGGVANALVNAAWLKRHPEVSATEWANWIGVATGVGAFLLWLAAGSDTNELLVLDNKAQIAIICIATGIGSAWAASILWNVASQRLSVSLCGQLIVSETLFALFYSFVWDGAWPATAQWLAVVLFTLGIVASIRAHR